MKAVTTHSSNNKLQTTMNKNNTDGSMLFVLAVTVFVVILFAYTAIDKIIAYEGFVFQMKLVPLPQIQSAAPFLGVAVPVAELAVAFFLILDKTRYRALIASLILMSSFEAYIIWMRSTGLDLPCTCGGIISQMSWTGHLIFNAVVIAMLFFAVFLEKRKWQTDKVDTPPSR